MDNKLKVKEILLWLFFPILVLVFPLLLMVFFYSNIFEKKSRGGINKK